MLCKIAELITEVPAAGGVAPRCAGYLTEEASAPEIIIRPELYRADCWPNLTPEQMEYMESGMQFYWHLLRYNGLMLHASAAALGGRAYLFSGPCGRGKSTHTHLWQQTFGEAVQVFNDDKPALRRLDGRWYAYGTPWCGKDGINLNQKWPLGGICFLEKSQENRIRRPPELRNHAPRGGGGRTMKLKENFVLRQVAGSYAVLAVGPYKRARISISPLLAGPNSV